MSEDINSKEKTNENERINYGVLLRLVYGSGRLHSTTAWFLC